MSNSPTPSIISPESRVLRPLSFQAGDPFQDLPSSNRDNAQFRHGSESSRTRHDFYPRYADRPVLVIGTHFATPTADARGIRQRQNPESEVEGSLDTFCRRRGPVRIQCKQLNFIELSGPCPLYMCNVQANTRSSTRPRASHCRILLRTASLARMAPSAGVSGTGLGVPGELLRLAGSVLREHNVDEGGAGEVHCLVEGVAQVLRILDKEALAAKSSMILS